MPDFVLDAVIPEDDDPVRVHLKHRGPKTEEHPDGEPVDFFIELLPELTALGTKVIARFSSDQAIKFLEAQVTPAGKVELAKAIRLAPISNKAVKGLADNLIKHYLGIEAGKSDAS